MNDHVHICSFSVGLDDLSRRQQKDAATVLRALKQSGGKFSVFEATANQDIAKTMDSLTRRKLVKNIDKGTFPWCYVEILPAGEKLIAEAPVVPKRKPGARRVAP